MKTSKLTIALALISLQLSAQEAMTVELKNGNTYVYKVEDVKRVFFDDKVPDLGEITLSTTELLIPFGVQKSVAVSGVNATECDVQIEDDYVASVSAARNLINVTGKHVGSTKITLSNQGRTAELTVRVNPTRNLFGNPCVMIGERYETVYAVLNPAAYQVSPPYIYEYDDYTIDFISRRYYFAADTLQYIGATISVNTRSADYYQYPQYLKEYAELDEIYNCKRFSNGVIYIFNRNNDYYIGLREKGQSDSPGWYVFYFKTKQEIIDKMDQNSSIAL